MTGARTPTKRTLSGRLGPWIVLAAAFGGPAISGARPPAPAGAITPPAIQTAAPAGLPSLGFT